MLLNKEKLNDVDVRPADGSGQQAKIKLPPGYPRHRRQCLSTIEVEREAALVPCLAFVQAFGDLWNML